MCAYVKPFKMQQNSFFLFEISFFVLEISPFSLMQKKQNGTLNVAAMKGAVLKQEQFAHPNLMMGVKTIWELCLLQVGTFVSL